MCVCLRAGAPAADDDENIFEAHLSVSCDVTQTRHGALLAGQLGQELSAEVCALPAGEDLASGAHAARTGHVHIEPDGVGPRGNVRIVEGGAVEHRVGIAVAVQITDGEIHAATDGSDGLGAVGEVAVAVVEPRQMVRLAVEVDDAFDHIDIAVEIQVGHDDAVGFIRTQWRAGRKVAVAVVDPQRVGLADSQLVVGAAVRHQHVHVPVAVDVGGLHDPAVAVGQLLVRRGEDSRSVVEQHDAPEVELLRDEGVEMGVAVEVGQHNVHTRRAGIEERLARVGERAAAVVQHHLPGPVVAGDDQIHVAVAVDVARGDGRIEGLDLITEGESSGAVVHPDGVGGRRETNAAVHEVDVEMAVSIEIFEHGAVGRIVSQPLPGVVEGAVAGVEPDLIGGRVAEGDGPVGNDHVHIAIAVDIAYGHEAAASVSEDLFGIGEHEIRRALCGCDRGGEQGGTGGRHDGGADMY